MSYIFSQDFINYNYTKGSSNRKISWLVIHYTGNTSDSAKANANYFKTNGRGASAHYFVDAANVIQIVKDEDISWAVGRNYGSNNLFGKCTNANSISIEMCSSGGRILDSTFDNTVALVKELMAKYDIPVDHVVRHYDVCSKQCPGWTGWLPKNETLWDKFKAQISTKEVKGGWQNVGSTWYYVDLNGKRVTAAWKKIQSTQDGKYYWYYFDKLGKMQTDWFQAADGKWYYGEKTGGYMGAIWKSDSNGAMYRWSLDN